MMLLFFFMVTLLLGLHITQPQAALYQNHICPNTTVFSLNSTFQTNLNSLFTTLSSNAAVPSGFHNATAGPTNTTDTVYGLFLCRGDVNTSTCNACVPTAIAEAVRQCPIQKDVVIWLDYCMVRYSNKSFFSVASQEGVRVRHSAQIGFEVDRFNQLLTESMMDAAAEAANGDKKFGTRQVNFTERISLYSLGQCTQDLSSNDCYRCLKIAIQELPGCCGGHIGGRVLYLSCYVRFETFPFYERAMLPPPPLPSSTKRESKDNKSRTVVILVVSIGSVLVIPILAICICLRLRKALQDRGAIKKRSSVRLNGEDLS